MRGHSQIQDHSTNPQRRLSADYYPLVARALASLTNGGRQAREAVYDRARKALLKHLSCANPPLSGAELAAELWALDQAIAQLESEAEQKVPPPVGAYAPSARPSASAAARPFPTIARSGPSAARSFLDGERPSAKPVSTAASAPASFPISARAFPAAQRQVPAAPSFPAAAARARPAAAQATPVRRATRSWNPVRRAALPALVASTSAWFGAIYFGPLYDPARPAASIIAVVLGAAFSTLLITSALAAWHRHKRCREAGLVKHLRSAFARRGVSANARRKIAQAMSDEDLFWAHFLPEHLSAAKEIIREELHERGYSQAQLDHWTPAAAGVTVPHTLAPPTTVERYIRLVRARIWAFYAYQAAMPALLTAPLGFLVYDLISSGQAHGIGTLAVMLGAVMLALAAAASLPFRKRMLRVLLLRPFGERTMTPALRNFVRNNAGPVANVFTLSDCDFKPGLVSMLWRAPAAAFDLLVTFFLGPLIGHSKRVASVGHERAFRRLERYLMCVHSLAFWSFMSGDQPFNIRSSQSWWQMCIQMLMHSCDVIVVDLSRVKEAAGWEINQLRANNLMSRCVFVIGEEHLADIGPVQEEYFAPDPPAIHVYRNDGKLADQSAFDARFAPVMEAALSGGSIG